MSPALRCHHPRPPQDPLIFPPRPPAPGPRPGPTVHFAAEKWTQEAAALVRLAHVPRLSVLKLRPVQQVPESFSAAERDSLRDGRTASIHSPISGCCVVTTCAVVSDTARMGVHVCGSRVTRTDGNSVYKFFEKLPTVLRSFYQDVI